MTFRAFSITAFLLLSAGGSMLINSCRKSHVGSSRTTLVNFVVPDGFPQPQYNFSSNPVTKEGFDLGRRLFHEERLAQHYDVTCGSCHQQMAAYTTFDHDLGHGTNHQHTTRNVPAIFNMAWQKEFEWDGKNSSLEEQMLSCITAPEKMGETTAEIVSRLDTADGYKQLFQAAFGDELITGDRVARALAQFVVMIVSADSKYDRVKKGLAQFTPSESEGYLLFQTYCTSCHAEPLFTDLSYRNTGLPHRDFHDDAGRMLVTGSVADSLKFKVPTLRNVGITSYYGHDGRYAGISEILDQYASGGAPSATLDPLVSTGFPLTNLQKFYIQEFLLTLSDSALVNDDKFQ